MNKKSDSISKVALFVNCYNSEKHLNETLESLVNQTYTNVDIICVDNHSIDSTYEIIHSFKKRHSFIKYIETDQHITLVKARIHALKWLEQNLQYAYFGFCDSDDLWDSTWVESLLKAASGRDLLYSNGFELYENGKLKPVQSCLAEEKHDVFSTHVYLQSFLLSTNLIYQFEEGLLDPNLPIHYDVDLFIRLRNMGISYAHISDRLFTYRIHSNSLSSTTQRWHTFIERKRMTIKHKLSLKRFYLITFLQMIQAPLLRVAVSK